MRLLTLVLCAALAACAPAAKSPEAMNRAAASNVSLSRMNTSFLYLAAQKAAREGQSDAAIRLLTALVQKDAGAAIPRLQLAELLLLRGRSRQALHHIDTVMAQKNFTAAGMPAISLLRARALAMLGRQPEALDTLEVLLAYQPGLFSARLLQVRLLQKAGRMDAAHAAIRQGIAANDTPTLRQLQAQLYLQENKLQEARQSFEAMHRLSPDSEAPVLLLHSLSSRMGDKAAAEQVLRTFFDSHENALRVGNALGRLLAEQKRLDEAIAVYEKLAARTQDAPEILAALGLLHYQKDHFSKAAALFRRSLQARQDAAVRFYLAASLEASGKSIEAARLYERFNPKNSAYAEAQLRLANMALKQGKLGKAARRLLTLISKQPEAVEAYSMLSSVRLAQEKYRQSIKETDPAMALKDVPTRLLFNRAAAFEHLRDYASAEAHLKRLLKIDPEHADALNFLGYLYAETGTNLDEAETLINRALKLKPNDGYYMDSLAWVYFKLGDYAGALDAQRKAIKQVADDPVMREHLGDILWRNGKAEEARQAWGQAIKLKHTEPAELRQKISKGL